MNMFIFIPYLPQGFFSWTTSLAASEAIPLVPTPCWHC